MRRSARSSSNPASTSFEPFGGRRRRVADMEIARNFRHPPYNAARRIRHVRIGRSRFRAATGYFFSEISASMHTSTLSNRFSAHSETPCSQEPEAWPGC